MFGKYDIDGYPRTDIDGLPSVDAPWGRLALITFGILVLFVLFGFKANAQPKQPRFYKDVVQVSEYAKLFVVEDTRNGVVCYIQTTQYDDPQKMQCVAKSGNPR